MWVKVTMMEDDSQLQEAILSLHHSYMISLDLTQAIKIIENQDGKSFISSVVKDGGRV